MSQRNNGFVKVYAPWRDGTFIGLPCRNVPQEPPPEKIDCSGLNDLMKPYLNQEALDKVLKESFREFGIKDE